MAMTWQELADFINNEMPECNKNEQATVWNAGESGDFFNIICIDQYDADEEPSETNFYSININIDDDRIDLLDVDALHNAREN